MADWGRKARWFGAEFLVVVTGVLVALGLQSWYERNADGQREQAYLRQLAAELRTTEATMVAADSFVANADRAGAMLLRSFRSAAPRDSILVWLNLVSRWSFHLPVTGTADALVTSGDLRLIGNDSLRGAITDYVGRHRPILQTLQDATRRWQDNVMELSRIVDLNEAAALRPEYAGAKARDPLFSPLPSPAPTRAFDIDTDALLRNRAAYVALDQMNSAKYISALMRTQIRERARTLRNRVEAQLAHN